MLSLPIPSSLDVLNYHDIAAPHGRSYGQIIDDLAGEAKIAAKGAHLDPDLVRGARPRRSDWRPTLGQISSAATHLRNQSVRAGDLFLFYGWFRPTEFKGGRLQFLPGKDGFHAVFGYLEVAEIIHASGATELPEWLHDHPHALSKRREKATNTIYVAADRLGLDRSLPGAGAFCFEECGVLTKPGMSRSKWGLDPDIFREVQISYHTGAAWRDDYFQSYPRGQEYVVHANDCVINWALSLIGSSARWDI